MRNILLIVLILIPMGLFATYSTSTVVGVHASGLVLPAITITRCADMLFPNNLVAGDTSNNTITTNGSTYGSHPACVSIDGCWGSQAGVTGGPASTTISSTSPTNNSYTVNLSYPNVVQNPQGNIATFYIDGYIYTPGTLVAGAYSGTFTVTAGCYM